MDATRGGGTPVSRAVVVQQHHLGSIATPPAVPIIDERWRLPTREDAWETPNYPYRGRNIALVTGGRIHYTAGPTSSTTLAIAQYQTGAGAQEDFPAIAYHYLIEGDGSVHWCHDLNRRVWGSGAPGSNEQDVHVCYTGQVEPNDRQLKGIRAALIDAQEKLGRSLTIKAHRDGYPTACPGPTWEQWRSYVLP